MCEYCRQGKGSKQLAYTHSENGEFGTEVYIHNHNEFKEIDISIIFEDDIYYAIGDANVLKYNRELPINFCPMCGDKLTTNFVDEDCDYCDFSKDGYAKSLLEANLNGGKAGTEVFINGYSVIKELEINIVLEDYIHNDIQQEAFAYNRLIPIIFCPICGRDL